jgi:hypothetical protein
MKSKLLDCLFLRSLMNFTTGGEIQAPLELSEIRVGENHHHHKLQSSVTVELVPQFAAVLFEFVLIMLA